MKSTGFGPLAQIAADKAVLILKIFAGSQAVTRFSASLPVRAVSQLRKVPE